MDKNVILKVCNDNRTSFVQVIKAKHKEFYDTISSMVDGKSFSEKLYRWIYNDELVGKCILCKNYTRFYSFSIGFGKYCSTKCANISSAPQRSGSKPKNLIYWEEKECMACKKSFWALKFRNQLFCSNTCSAQATAKDVSRLNKIRMTKMERYGSETYVNPEKAKQTCIEKYGVDNASKSKDVIEKIKHVNQERYGVDWTWQSEEVKNKIKNVNLLRYGVEYPSQSRYVKQKMIQTYLKKYGVENPFQCEKIKENIRKQYKKKFGMEYPSQIDEVRNKIVETVRKNNYKLLCSSPRVVNTIKILFQEEEYKGATSDFKYKVECKKCGNVFVDHFDGNGHPRCLVCYPNIAGFSYAEKEILLFVRYILPQETIIEKDRNLLGNRELDIYIPSKKIAIEYDGLFWHSETNGKKLKTYHLDKSERCFQKGVQLITIFEDEWENNQDIVKVRIKHLLQSTTDRVYARKCNIQEISSKHSNIFLDRHHIQGGCSSSIRIGLFFSNELVAVMTFGKPRISLGMKNVLSGEYELLRYASSKSVVGGASKLLVYFVKIYNPLKIVSYADKRWSTGNLYNKLGFNVLEDTDPNYWYFKPGYAIRYHRFGFRKSVLKNKLDLFDPELTEWENMQLNGYDRIWDCGNIKYEWKRDELPTR